MSKHSRCAIAVTLVGMFLTFVVVRTVLVAQQHARLEKRIHAIQELGEVYSILSHEKKGQLVEEDLRLHLPKGFPLDRYEFMPPYNDTQDLVAANDLVIVKEATKANDGKRLLFCADGSVHVQRD